MLSITNIPTHAWLVKTMQMIVGTSYLIKEVTPDSLNGADLSWFMTVAWVVHLDLILVEVDCIILEPDEPFVEHESPFFLSASKVIHSKRDTL
jgi:hypothetical protein